MNTMKMIVALALFLILAAPVVANEPRCEPLAVGAKATLEEAAMSIATCGVEHAITLIDGRVLTHTIGTADAMRVKVPADRAADALVIHNHPSGLVKAGPGDTCAALALRELHVVIASGKMRPVNAGGSALCQKIQAQGVRARR